MNRITHNVQQGTPEWHALRASHYTASEAAAMMGASPYMSRAELLRRKASGMAEEPDAARQRLFDSGHAAEAAARPAAEEVIGEELFPAVMTAEVEGLPLLASLDGLTMDGTAAWEHKLMSERINKALIETDMPPMDHVWQLEHQLLVSGADEVHYWASHGQGPYSMRIYRSDPARRKALIEGWKQFQRDLNDVDMTNFRPAPEPVQAKPVPGFGTLTLRVEGRVLASNLDAFRAGADAFLARLPKPADLQTDQDFADAEAAAKACGEAEARIKAAKEQAIAQMADVEAVLRTADEVAETIRQARLALERSVKARKDEVRAEAVRRAADRVRESYAALAVELGEYAPGIPASLSADLASGIKGLKKLDSIRDRLDEAVAKEQVDLALWAERIRKGRALLEAAIAEHGALWPDAPRLAQTLDEEAIRGVIRERVAEHQERQRKREEAERERIAAELAAQKRALEEQAAELARQQREIEEARQRAATPAAPVATEGKADTPEHGKLEAAAGPAVECVNSRNYYPATDEAPERGRGWALVADGTANFPCGTTGSDTLLLAQCLELTEYAAAAFSSRFPSHPKPGPEWWAGLRERIERLQPMLRKASGEL